MSEVKEALLPSPDFGLLATEIARGAVKALSIRQPFPHYILHDGKDIENRDWPTRGRGWVLVHAGTRPYDPVDMDEIQQRRMPMGGIVGIMRIVDCVTESDSRWFHGSYGFVLEQARPIPLVSCKGALGFFLPPADVLASVAAHVRDLAHD